MTREEYESLLSQKSAIETKLEELDSVAWEILKAMGIEHHGDVEFRRIEDGKAYIRYRTPGCSCHPDHAYIEVPPHWMFGGDFVTEVKAQKEREKATLAELAALEAEKKRLEQEAQDLAEFDRLKKKFEEKQA